MARERVKMRVRIMRFVLSLALLAVLFPVQASAQVSWRTAMETVREKQETYRQNALDKNPAAVRAGNSPEALEGLRQFHGCAIIGRIVGQTDAIREMESFDDPDLETSSAETLFLHSEFLRAWVEAADGVLALSADQRSSVWDDLCVENYGRVHGLERLNKLNELNEERPYTSIVDLVAPVNPFKADGADPEIFKLPYLGYRNGNSVYLKVNFENEKFVWSPRKPNLIDGYHTFYYPDGRSIFMTTSIKNGELDELYTEYYASGQKRAELEMRNGEITEIKFFSRVDNRAAAAEEKRMLEENAAELLQAAIAAERENVRYFVESVNTELSEWNDGHLFAQIDDRYFVVKGVSEAGMMGLMRALGRDEAPSDAEPVPEAWVNENEISAELMQKIRQGEVITDPRFGLGAVSYSFYDILDLNGDGYDELIFSGFYGGNVPSAFSLNLATHIGEGAFSIYGISYGREEFDPVKFTQIGSKIAFSLKTEYRNSLSSVSTSYILKDDGELIEIDEQLTSYAGDIIAPLEIWNDVHGTDVDLNFDGEPEHISHWTKAMCWGAEVEVRSHDPGEGELFRGCCPALGVLNSVTNGYRDLVCNRSEVYRFNGGYYN